MTNETTEFPAGNFEVFPTLIKAAALNYAMNKVLLSAIFELTEKMGGKPFPESSAVAAEKIEEYRLEFIKTYSK